MGRQLALVLVLVSGCHSLWPDDDLVGNGRLVDIRPKVESFTGIVIAGEPVDRTVRISDAATVTFPSGR